MSCSAAILALFLACSAAAQEDPGGSGKEQGKEQKDPKDPKGNKLQKIEKIVETQTADDGKGDASSVDGTGAVHVPALPNDQGITFRGFTDPKRLGPGETGTAYVQIDVRGDTVVLASALRLEYRPEQLPLFLGAHAFDQPKTRALGPGKQAVSGFHDTFLARVPITIDASAKHGKYPLNAKLGFIVMSPTTGATSAQINRDVHFDIEVGNPVPRPVARPAASNVPKDPKAAEASANLDWSAEVKASGDVAATLRLAVEPAVVAPGARGTLHLRFDLPNGARMARDGVRVAFEPMPPGFAPGSATVEDDGGEATALTGRVQVAVPFELAADAAIGVRKLNPLVTASIASAGAPRATEFRGTVDLRVEKASVYVADRAPAPHVETQLGSVGSGANDGHEDGPLVPWPWLLVGGGAVLLGLVALLGRSSKR